MFHDASTSSVANNNSTINNSFTGENNNNNRLTPSVHRDFSSATLPHNNCNNNNNNNKNSHHQLNMSYTIQRTNQNTTVSQSSLNSTTNGQQQQQFIHLSSFQTNNISTTPSGSSQPCTRKPTFSMQPPKPPERSCSFKDVENLHQQQLGLCTSPPPIPEEFSVNPQAQQQILPTSNSKRQLSSFSLLQNSIREVETPPNNQSLEQDQDSLADSPVSNQSSTTIKITSMKLNDDDLPMPISPSGNSNRSPSWQQNYSRNMTNNSMHGIDQDSDKFSTLPSSLKSPGVQKLKPVNKTKAVDQNDQQQIVGNEIPEFQRVFSHLRKVSVPEKAKQNGNVSSNSTGN